MYEQVTFIHYIFTSLPQKKYVMELKFEMFLQIKDNNKNGI